MSSLANARDLIKILRGIAPFLTSKEISDVGEVLLKATMRMEKEAEDEGMQDL